MIGISSFTRYLLDRAVYKCKLEQYRVEAVGVETSDLQKVIADYELDQCLTDAVLTMLHIIGEPAKVAAYREELSTRV